MNINRKTPTALGDNSRCFLYYMKKGKLSFFKSGKKALSRRKLIVPVQIIEQFLARSISLSRIKLSTLIHYICQARRYSGLVFLNRIQEKASFANILSRQKTIHCNSDCVNISSGVGLSPAPELLGCRIPVRSKTAGIACLSVLIYSHNAEIYYSQSAARL